MTTENRFEGFPRWVAVALIVAVSFALGVWLLSLGPQYELGTMGNATRSYSSSGELTEASTQVTLAGGEDVEVSGASQMMHDGGNVVVEVTSDGYAAAQGFAAKTFLLVQGHTVGWGVLFLVEGAAVLLAAVLLTRLRHARPAA